MPAPAAVSPRARLACVVTFAACLLLAVADHAGALVLRDSDFLLATGADLLVVGPDRPATRLGSLDPEQAEVDSQGRIVFLALDRHLTFARVFRWDPETGVREILYPGGMVIYHLALESDASAVVSGVRTEGGIVRGVFRIDFATGEATPVSTGGFLDEFSPLDVDPTDGSIVVFGPNAVVRVDPETGQQTPVASANAPNPRVAVDPTGQIFVYGFTGGVTSPVYRVDEEAEALVPVASTYRIDDMDFEADGTLLAVGRPSHLSAFTGLLRIDVGEGSVDEFTEVSASSIALDGSGRIYASGTTGAQPDIEDRPAIVRIDPETGEKTTLFQKPLGITGAFVRGAVLRSAEGGEKELLVFTSSGRIVRLDPLDGAATTVVEPAGLLSPAPTTPNPIVARSGEVMFLNDATSSLLALRPNGTVRFVSAGNLLDDPSAVAEEPAGGSYLVASSGAQNPGLVRVTDEGAQSPVLPGAVSVLDVAIGQAYDAVIRTQTQLYGVDTGTGDLDEIPQPAIGRLASVANGRPLAFATPAGVESRGIYSLRDADGDLGLLALTPDVTSVAHLHAVPEPRSGAAAAVALLALGWARATRAAARDEGCARRG